MSEPDIADRRDRQAMQDIAARNARAHNGLEVLVRAYGHVFRRMASDVGLGHAEKQDFAQEVFLQIWEKAHLFRGQSRALTWMYTIAKNRLADRFRRVRPEVQLDDEQWLNEVIERAEDPSHRSACELAAQHSVQQCFDEGFARFKQDHPRAAQVLELAALQQVDSRELAQMLNKTPGAFREFLSQCKKKFRPYVEACRHLLGDLP